MKTAQPVLPSLKVFICKIIVTYYSFSESTCTKDHPFAYNNGQHCCETNQELVNGGNSDEVASGTCDGIGFSIESTCCKDHKYLKCPHTKCKDYGGKDYEKFDTVSKILKLYFGALFIKSNQYWNLCLINVKGFFLKLNTMSDWQCLAFRCGLPGANIVGSDLRFNT